VNSRAIFDRGKFAKLAISGEPEPILLVVVGVKERGASVDLTSTVYAVGLGLTEGGGICGNRYCGSAGLYGLSGGKKNYERERDTDDAR
jgi:hypothetical protein